jgi:hypothetical protein
VVRSVGNGENGATIAAIALLQGEDVQLSNCYIQGSQLASGVYLGPEWNSEFMMTNSRIFGHHLAGIEIAGGAHTLISNNIIGDNSIAAPNASSGILVRSGASDFVLVGNHVGSVFRGQTGSAQRHGVEIEPGASDRWVALRSLAVLPSLRQFSKESPCFGVTDSRSASASRKTPLRFEP